MKWHLAHFEVCVKINFAFLIKKFLRFLRTLAGE
jgi:hypothetical protein